jgi:single-strand DNA-binding protein
MAIARFSIAVDRRTSGEASADFPSCVAFGKTAEFIEKFFKQGMKVALEGRLQTGSYTNRDGNKVYTTDVIVEAAEFAESKKVSEEAAQPSAGFMEIPTDIENDLPFK